MPKFDPTLVTHIVTDAQAQATLRALGLKTLDDIPDHIPTVKWSWIVSGIEKAPDVFGGQGTNDVELDEVWLHAAFSKRINAGISRVIPLSSRSRMKDKTVDISNIS
jgi:DNA polymerase lambda